MDAKVNDPKILLKKLVLDSNMNRGVAVGMAVALAAAAATATAAATVHHPHPLNPSRQPKTGAASQCQA